MAQPTPYNRIFNFTSWSTSHPTSQQPGVSLDAEYNAIKLTTDQIRTNLAKIQRDDGSLANLSVTPDSLSAATKTLLSGWNPRGAWAAATAYAVGDFVTSNGKSYVCFTAHTSGVSLDTAMFSLVTTAPVLVSVTDYGAKGDGVTDDTAAIQSAINAAAASGGIVLLPGGVFIVAGLNIKSKVILQGAGRYGTFLRGKPSVTGAVVQTDAFASLTGTASPSGPSQWSIRDLTIDGNAASRASGNGLNAYGWDWSLVNVDVANCPGIGINSEWSNVGGAPAFPPAVTGEPECHITNVRVYGNTGDGIVWAGPNDAQMHQVLVYVNGGYGIRLNSTASSSPVGTMLSQVHIYHNGNWGLQTNSVITAANLESESQTAGGGIQVTGGGAIFGANVWAFNNTGIGIDIESTYRTVLSSVASNNNTSHGILVNGPVNLSAVMLVQNGGDGINFGASSGSSQITAAAAQLNSGKGFSIQQNDQTLIGINALNNTGNGVSVANGTARLTLHGNAIGNTTQLALGTLGAGCDIQFALNSAGGSGTWTGTPGTTSNVKILSSGTDSFFSSIAPVIMPSYAKASLPSAATHARGLIYVTDDVGGATPAFSDGTNWRRVADRAVIS